LALGGLGIASPLLAVSFAVGHEALAPFVAALVLLCPVALVVVAVGRVGALVAALALLLAVSTLGTFLASPAPALLGLPAAALWMLGGLWLAPLVVLSVGFPRSFS
jgi:hypothetical protein